MSREAELESSSIKMSASRRRMPAVIVGVCLVSVAVLQLLRGNLESRILFDEALFNLISVGFLVIAGVTTWFWFLFRSEFALPLLRACFIVSLLFLVFLVLSVRVEGVTGNMIPTGWRWAWNKPHDFSLAKPTASSAPVAKPLAAESQVNETTKVEASPVPPPIQITPHDYPQFLGPERNAVLPEAKLAHDWSSNPPKEKWRKPVGAGWSGFVVVGDRAITLEQYGAEEVVTCRKLADGETIWTHAVPARHEEFMGGIGPRSTPTIHEGKVYTSGATGMIHCLDLRDGKPIWSDDLLKRYGISQQEDNANIMWGRAGSVLIHGDLAIIPAGGPKGSARSLIAYDKQTGTVKWEGGTTQISYASPCVMTLAGREQIVIVNEDDVTGHDPTDGKVLWSFPWPGKSSANASSSQPHFVGDDRVLLSKGYGEGAALIAVKQAEEKFVATELWRNPKILKTKFTNAAVSGDYVYGLSDGVLECASWIDGKSRWKNGRFGHGQILIAGDVILVQTEKTGEVVMVALDPEKFRELGRATVLSGRGQAWNNLCLVDKLLLVRNAEEAVCLELP